MPKPAKAQAKKAATTKKTPLAQKISKSGGSKSLEAAPRAPAPRKSAVTHLDERFIQEYLVDLNGTQAYLRAVPGTKENTARVLASRLLTKVDIQAAIRKARKEREIRTEISADRVIQEAWAIMTADPRELMEFVVGCCRYCWGDGHRYQRTAAEFEADEAAHAKATEDAITAGKPVTGFDPKGGNGYDKRAEPNPECPECAGEGVGRPVFKDTRKISAAAASLFAGVKETKEGFELKVHSKDAAMDKMFRHMGLYNDKIQLTMPTAIIKDLTGRK